MEGILGKHMSFLSLRMTIINQVSLLSPRNANGIIQANVLSKSLDAPPGASLQLYSFTMELIRCSFCWDETYAYYSTLSKSNILPEARLDPQIPILGTSGDVKSKKPEWRIKYACMIGVHIPENGNQDGNYYQTTKSCRDPR